MTAPDKETKAGRSHSAIRPSTVGRHAAPAAPNEYQTEAQAKGHCGAGTVVWVNMKSGVYHFAGTHNYGTTKEGAYMCETNTAVAGFRAAKNEKHP